MWVKLQIIYITSILNLIRLQQERENGIGSSIKNKSCKRRLAKTNTGLWQQLQPKMSSFGRTPSLSPQETTPPRALQSIIKRIGSINRSESINSGGRTSLIILEIEDSRYFCHLGGVKVPHHSERTWDLVNLSGVTAPGGRTIGLCRVTLLSVLVFKKSSSSHSNDLIIIHILDPLSIYNTILSRFPFFSISPRPLPNPTLIVVSSTRPCISHLNLRKSRFRQKNLCCCRISRLFINSKADYI